LNERKAEIRIQFKKFPGSLFSSSQGVNELVLRLQPNEAIYMKLVAKTPGLSNTPMQTELDLTYKHRYILESLPDAYERLILDSLIGNHSLFVRHDELSEAWRIFTPVLHKIEKEKIKPEIYTFGSRGPPSSEKMITSLGFRRNPSTSSSSSTLPYEYRK